MDCFLGSSLPPPNGDALGSGLSGSNIKIYGIDVVDDATFWGIARNANWGTAVTSFVRTTDQGATWSSGSIDAQADFSCYNLFALDASTAWVAMRDISSWDAAAMYKTVDGGATWTEQSGPFNETGHGIKSVHFFDADRGVAVGSAGQGLGNQGQLRVYETSDGGATWTENTTGLPTLGASEGTYTESGSGGYAAVGDNIWVGTTEGNILRSTDRGATWTSVSSGFTGNNVNVSSIAFRDDNNGIAVSEFRQASQTTDGGQTWTPLANFSSSLIGLTTAQIAYVPGTNDTYVICDGIFNLGDLGFTNDDGATWDKAPYGVSMEAIAFRYNGLGFGGGTVSGGTGGTYLWKNPAPGTTTAIEAPIVADFVTAYPNPVRQTLFLKTELATPFSYQLIDLQGRILMQGEGLGEQALSVANFPAGVYALRVRAQGQAQTLKVRVE